MSLTHNETALLVAFITAIAGLAKPLVAAAIEAHKEKISRFDLAIS